MNTYLTDKQRIDQGLRLREFRKHVGMTQSDFSDSIEMHQGSYSDIERGKNGMSNAFLIRLIAKYRINLNWLLSGEGEMEYVSKSTEIKQGAINDQEEKSETGKDKAFQIESIKAFLKEKFPDFE